MSFVSNYFFAGKTHCYVTGLGTRFRVRLVVCEERKGLHPQLDPNCWPWPPTVGVSVCPELIRDYYSWRRSPEIILFFAFPSSE